MRVLVVDDDPDLSMLMQLVLSRQGGHDVDTAGDGLEAFALLAASEYDVVVLDWNIRQRGRGRGSAIFLHVAKPGYPPTQGCVGVEIRSDDEEARKILQALDHRASHVCAWAERGFLAALDGSCRTPIAAYAVLEGETLHLRGEALSPDGTQRWARESRDVLQSADAVEAEQFGRALGLAVKEAGGEALMRAVSEGL